MSPTLEPWPSLVAAELVRVRVPLVRPHVFAGGEERERDVVLVRAVGDDGAEGWGECSSLSAPGYVGATTDASWSALADDLLPRWLHAASPRPPRSTGSSMAWAAIEEAALDLVLRARGVALADRLADELGPRRSSVEWCAVVSMTDVAATVDEARAAVALGARQVKLKIAPGHDVDVLRAVRGALPDVALAADANGAYRSVDDVPSSLFDIGLAYLEQPLGADDVAGAAELARRGHAIALDESLASPRALELVWSSGTSFVLSVKVPRCGGVTAAVELLARAHELGCSAFVGGMLETAVGRAVALAMAAQAPCTHPSDAGPTSRYFTADVGAAFEPDADGRLHPPPAPGIGVVPRDDALDRFCVDRLVLAT